MMNPLQEKLQKLVQYRDELKAELEHYVRDAWNEYLKVESEFRRTTNAPTYGWPKQDVGYDDFDLSPNGVDINWSESWAYGGYDSGIAYLSYDYIFNKEVREKHAADLKIEAEKYLKDKTDKENKIKLSEFERLRKELNQ